MTKDSWLSARELVREQRRDPWAWILSLLFFAGVYYIFYQEAINPYSDLCIHAGIASQFDFGDLHSITCRIAYPLWHVFVSAINKLGAPLAVAAAAVTATFKTLFFATVQCLLLPKRGERGRVIGWVFCISMMIVTCLMLPWFNERVYQGVGSPTVWHNPTQITAIALSMICVPYLMHCWCEFEHRLAAGEQAIQLKWGQVIALALWLGLIASAKPTVLQALIPAAFVLFLVEWIRQPKQWRYFLQIVLAFVPAVAYFLLQYLYYTGVVVEYTSGVVFSVSAEGILEAVRNMLMMTAFPLLALLCQHQKGKKMDRTLVLVLLMLVFSVLEAACFHETGLRQAHGNFTWATGSSAILLWWLALRSFWDEFRACWQQRAQHKLRTIGYALSWALLTWHVLSGLHYIFFHILILGNAF